MHARQWVPSATHVLTSASTQTYSLQVCKTLKEMQSDNFPLLQWMRKQESLCTSTMFFFGFVLHFSILCYNVASAVFQLIQVKFLSCHHFSHLSSNDSTLSLMINVRIVRVLITYFVETQGNINTQPMCVNSNVFTLRVVFYALFPHYNNFPYLIQGTEAVLHCHS